MTQFINGVLSSEIRLVDRIFVNVVLEGSDGYIGIQKRDNIDSIPYPEYFSFIGGAMEDRNDSNPKVTGRRELAEELAGGKIGDERWKITYDNADDQFIEKPYQLALQPAGITLQHFTTHPDKPANLQRARRNGETHWINYFYFLKLNIPLNGYRLHEGTGTSFPKNNIQLFLNLPFIGHYAQCLEGIVTNGHIESTEDMPLVFDQNIDLLNKFLSLQINIPEETHERILDFPRKSY